MANTRRWQIVVVDDNADIRRQLREYFDDEAIAEGKIVVSEYSTFEEASHLIENRKADTVILDVYEGDIQENKRKGVDTLEKLKSSGFVPVILYTAKPEGLEGLVSPFLRLVSKDAEGLSKLEGEIKSIFDSQLPQMHRAIWNHMDLTLSKYMWGFVLQNWKDFATIANKPEFLRLLIQRLGTSFARQGVDTAVTTVFGEGAAAQLTDPEKVHPSEYFIKPPMGTDPMLGDIRTREVGGKKEYWVVLWPSCDMVSSRKHPKTGQNVPAKTTHVLCAQARDFAVNDQMQKWTADGAKDSENQVRSLLHNNKSDQWHFLPGVWDIPDLLVDFQSLHHFPLAEAKGLTVLATLASPFAESVSSRFCRYLGRLGTPDLDVELIMNKLKKGVKKAPTAEAPGPKKKAT